jgi:hypothetical protein
MTITLADAISAQVRDALAALRACLVDSEDDPLLDICLEAGVSADAGEAIPDRFAIHAVLDVLTDAIPSALARRGTNYPQALPGDLVGFVAGGVVARGFCSTVGASRWFERFSIALDASTLFSRLLAGALTMIFFTYAFVNMGMVSGILPVVGVPLPFVSYGGTAMVTLGLALGMLLSIARAKRLVQT